MSVFRRFFDCTHVFDAGQGHVQCPGDGCRRQSEYVHILPELLDTLLVADAEPLLLIHHQKSQVMELHIL